jgi:Tol biopolymer transport system component
MGITKRGELERFDLKKRLFIPYLSGISAEWLAFSRDGSRIAYVSLPEGNLWVCKSAGSSQRELTFAPVKASSPQWSPDGKQVAFVGAEPGKADKIYLIQAEGGNPEQLTEGNKTEADELEIDPSWSPNGEALAFGSDLETAVSSKQHPIRILNIKSRELTVLPDSGGYFSPRWSPDGRWIVAIDALSGALELFNVSTRKWEQLTKLRSSYPSWSQDSQCIYFTGGATADMQLPQYRLCLRDRKPQVVVDLAQVGPTMSDVGGWSGVAPDGSILAVRDTSLEEIYLLELDLP